MFDGPSTAHSTKLTRALQYVERVGNRLPDPATLFVGIGVLVLLCSWIGSTLHWSVTDPRDASKQILVDNLLDADSVRWMFTSALKNFLDFPPLAIVLVAMLGIGVAERTGLFPALLKLLVRLTPARFITPVIIFIGVNSSAAADSGYVVLPPLAAGVFAIIGRSPLVGIAAAVFGIAGGFSANIAITSLDPLLSGLTEQAAQTIDPTAVVAPTANYAFMFASTFFLTALGWFVTAKFVEPRFSAERIAAQIAQGGILESHANLSAGERRGLLAALVAFVVVGSALLSMALIEGGPLTGVVTRHATNTLVPAWSEALVPIILVMFLVPGVAYGVAVGEIRSDRAVTERMGQSISSMGTYIVIAFFAGQAIAWFRQSNLSVVMSVEGAEIIRSMGLGQSVMIVAIIWGVAVLDLFLSSASAKWTFLAPVLVPMLATAGMQPDLVQAAYRVGDSCVNPIAPLNAYLVIILVVIRRYDKSAGLGTLFALLAPYSLAALVAWSALLVAWNALGIPLAF